MDGDLGPERALDLRALPAAERIELIRELARLFPDEDMAMAILRRVGASMTWTEPAEAAWRRIVEGDPGADGSRLLASCLSENPDLEIAATLGVATPAVAPISSLTPDLTIRIERAIDQTSQVGWTWTSRFSDIVPTREPQWTSLGDDPEEFVLNVTRDVIRRLRGRDDEPAVVRYLLGAGRRIAAAMPDALWPVFDQLLRKVRGRLPVVLLVSDELHVPWELAVHGAMGVDAGESTCLGCRIALGRMPGDVAANAPSTGSFRDLHLISGTPAGVALPAVGAEIQELRAMLGPERVQTHVASYRSVMELLTRPEPLGVLHFALHGSNPSRKLVLADGDELHAYDVETVRLANGPLVFLNACHAGGGFDALGSAGGLAAAFLRAGASGVIAPLMPVRDSIAARIAAQFYRLAITGRPAADCMVELRAAFEPSPVGAGPACSYQFYGHPASCYPHVADART